MPRRVTRALPAGRSGRPAPVVIRFIIIFAATFGAAELVFHAVLLRIPPSNPFMRANAAAAEGVLRLCGRAASRDGEVLTADGGTPVQVKWGCDGLEPIGVFLSGLAAFPGSWRRKLVAAAPAIPVLLAINVLRIAGLAMISAHAPASLTLVHTEILPAALVLIALALWLCAAAWVVRQTSASVGGAADAPR